MANTYVKIGSTVTVGAGGAANIEFTAIPSTYTDLLVKLSLRSESNGYDEGGAFIKFNALTTGYTTKRIQGNGASALSYSSTTYPEVIMSGSTGTANTFGNSEFYIPNYAGNQAKSISIDSIQEQNGTTAYSRLIAGLNTTTAAITSLTITDNGGGDLAQYSTATLYGILKS